MQYVYAGMWLLIGLLLIFRAAKENHIFYFAGGFFILLGLWWFADTLTDINLLSGAWGWGLRGVTAVTLAVFCIAFYRERKKSTSKQASGSSEGSGRGDAGENDKDGNI